MFCNILFLPFPLKTNPNYITIYTAMKCNPIRIVFTITIFIALSQLVTTPSPVYSKDKTPMEKKVTWLSDVHGWKPAGDTSLYNSKTIFQYMNGAAELYLAYNFRELKTVRFENPGKPSIIVEVYDMASSEDAYGVFTFEKQDPDAGIGQGSEFGGGLLRFWKGRNFVTIFGEEPGQDIEEAILILGRRIAGSIVHTGDPPRIILCLPDKALSYSRKDVWFFRSHIHLNQRYFVARANILMLTLDVGAVFGRYETRDGRIHVLLVHYPSPDKAESALSSFKNTYMHDAGPSDSVKTENGRWTSMARLDRYVVVVFDAVDESTSLNLINVTREILKKEGLW